MELSGGGESAEGPSSRGSTKVNFPPDVELERRATATATTAAAYHRGRGRSMSAWSDISRSSIRFEERYHICERPSLKNFYVSDDLAPIFYSTGEVCKADSQSTLSILDPHDKADIRITPNEDKIRSIIKVLRKEIGLLLAGFDVVIDNSSGNHAVIDINVFPSYDNYPDFFEHFLDCINESSNRTCSEYRYNSLNKT